MVDVVREEICVAYPINRKVKINVYFHDFCSFPPLCQVIPFFHPFTLVPVVVVVPVLELKVTNNNNIGSLHVSKKLPTHPSPEPTFCPK